LKSGFPFGKRACPNSGATMNSMKTERGLIRISSQNKQYHAPKWGSQSWLPPAFSRRKAAWKGGCRQDCLPH
jgi:hypothetical protein